MENKKRITRTFNVNFLPLVKLEEKNNKLVSKPYDITNSLKKMVKIKPDKRIKNINGTSIRLQDIKHLQPIDNLELYSNIGRCKNLWVLTFIKFIDDQVFGIADEKGSYSEEMLENMVVNSAEDNPQNKGHLASATVCLYVGDKKLFIIANNKEGVTNSEVLDFIIKVTDNNDLRFGFVSKNAKLNLKDVYQYKNIQLGFRGLQSMSNKEALLLEKNSPSVYLAIKGVRKFGGDSLNLVSTMGKSKKGFKEDFGNELLNLINLDNSVLSKAILGYTIDDKSKISTINFLEDKLKSSFVISREQYKRIKTNDIKEKLLCVYDENYNNC